MTKIDVPDDVIKRAGPLAEAMTTWHQAADSDREPWTAEDVIAVALLNGLSDFESRYTPFALAQSK